MFWTTVIWNKFVVGNFSFGWNTPQNRTCTRNTSGTTTCILIFLNCHLFVVFFTPLGVEKYLNPDTMDNALYGNCFSRREKYLKPDRTFDNALYYGINCFSRSEKYLKPDTFDRHVKRNKLKISHLYVLKGRNRNGRNNRLIARTLVSDNYQYNMNPCTAFAQYGHVSTFTSSWVIILTLDCIIL